MNTNNNNAEMTNTGHLDDIDEATIIVKKKKESYRVEIRRRKIDETLAISRQKLLSSSVQGGEITVPKFESRQEEDGFFVKMIADLQVSVCSCVQNKNQTYVDELMRLTKTLYNAVVVNDDQANIELSKLLIRNGILTTLLPIIEDNSFEEYTFLLNQIYNLYGTLFFADSQILEPYLSENIIKALVNSLHSKDSLIVEQGFFLVGNMIGGSIKTKNIVYQLGCIDSLFDIHKSDKLNEDNYGPLFWERVQEMIWLISMFFEKKTNFRNNISLKDHKKLIEILFDLLATGKFLEQEDVKNTRLLTATMFEAIGTKDILLEYFFKLQTLKNVNLVEQFLEIMRNCDKYDPGVVINISRFIFNIVSGPDEYVEGLLHYNLLDILQILFTSSVYSKYYSFIPEIIWSMSNIASMSSKTIQVLIDHPLFCQLMNNFSTHDPEIQREALYILINIFKIGSTQQKRIILKNYMDIYMRSLDSQGTKMIINLLDGIDSLLQTFSGIFTANGENLIMADLEKHNFSGFMNKLQKHPSELVYQAVSRIIEKHLHYS